MSIVRGSTRYALLRRGRRGVLALAVALLMATALPALSDHFAGTTLVAPASAGDHQHGTGGG